MTPAQIRTAASALGRLGAAKGGRARAAAMAPEERREQARQAVLARWKRRRQSAANGGDLPPR